MTATNGTATNGTAGTTLAAVIKYNGESLSLFISVDGH
jgi:hypothetical protein